MALTTKPSSEGFLRFRLGDEDSNLGTVIQSHMSYH